MELIAKSCREAYKRAKFFNIAALSVLLLLLLLLLPSPAEAIAGRASYYTAPYTPSACYGFDTSQLPSDGNFAAANPSIYGGGAACGSNYRIACTGAGCTGGGPITVKIVDLCPGCPSNQFDLSQEAFAKIANLDVGVISIDYTMV